MTISLTTAVFDHGFDLGHAAGVTLEDGTRLDAGQGNNAYIFPGVRLTLDHCLTTLWPLLTTVCF